MYYYLRHTCTYWYPSYLWQREAQDNVDVEKKDNERENADKDNLEEHGNNGLQINPNCI